MVDKQFCIICGVETEWYEPVSTRVMCEDCRRHQLTPVLDYFTSKDEIDTS